MIKRIVPSNNHATAASFIADILKCFDGFIKINIISPRKAGPYISFKGNVYSCVYNEFARREYIGYKSMLCIKCGVANFDIKYVPSIVKR